MVHLHHHEHEHSHAHAASHHHSEPHQTPSGDPQQFAVARIRKAFFLNISFALVELIGGFWSGSAAIVADAIHDLGDSLSLVLALYLQKKANGEPSSELTYGYRRYSILSALFSGLVICMGSSLVLWSAVPKLFAAQELPHIPSMVGLALLGLAVNGFAAFGLARGHTHSERILSWHLIEDFLGWLVVLIGAFVIKIFGYTWIDPLLAILISLFVLYNVAKHLRAPLRIILQYAPTAREVEELRACFEGMPEVVKVEQLHAWTLDGHEHVLTAKLILRQGTDSEALRRSLRELLGARGYRHVTLETEIEKA